MQYKGIKIWSFSLTITKVFGEKRKIVKQHTKGNAKHTKKNVIKITVILLQKN